MPEDGAMSKTTAHSSTSPATLFAVAACAMALTAGNEVQLLPAGDFSARDGRPTDAPHWRIDATLAQNLIAAAQARGTPYVIDYEHQTMLARQNGQPAPAAGWFSKLEWRDGVGLFATDVQWTDKAREMIAAKEYRFISPVIAYDKDGNVTALYMAAITNNPAIDGMDEVLVAAASLHFAQPVSLTQETPTMDELLEQLRWLLNLPVGATAQDILAQLNKLADTIKQGVPEATAAASFDLTAHLQAQHAQIASLSSATPDPSKYVAIGVMRDLQTKYAELSAQLNAGKIDALVKEAIAKGKLLPAQEAWAREYGAKDFTGLSSYIENAPPLAVLSGQTQTGGKKPANTEDATLTLEQIAMCTAMGVPQEDFLKTLKAEGKA